MVQDVLGNRMPPLCGPTDFVAVAHDKTTEAMEGVQPHHLYAAMMERLKRPLTLNQLSFLQELLNECHEALVRDLNS